MESRPEATTTSTGSSTSTPLVLRLGEDGARERQLVLLDAALLHVLALRGEEGVGHGAADGERVDDGEERLDHVDLVGDLGAAEDGDVGLLGPVGEAR